MTIISALSILLASLLSTTFMQILKKFSKWVNEREAVVKQSLVFLISGIIVWIGGLVGMPFNPDLLNWTTDMTMTFLISICSYGFHSIWVGIRNYITPA